MKKIGRRTLPESASDKRKIPPVGAWGNYRRHKRYGAMQFNAVQSDAGQSGEKRLLIDVKELSLAYEGRSVISGLSLQIHSGDFLCIIGENGSGKTTLTNALLGLKSPSSGSMELCGLKRNEIGVLLQRTDVQSDFPALVGEVVLSGRVGKKRGIAMYTRHDRQVAFENMEKLGITSIADKSFRTLSGGQQQRALLARALCAAEKLIVLDEPAASLDPKACADMYSLIRDINANEGMAVIMVSHDIRCAREYATHVLHIDKGAHRMYTREEYLRENTEDGVTSEKSHSAYGDSDAYRYKGGESNA